MLSRRWFSPVPFTLIAFILAWTILPAAGQLVTPANPFNNDVNLVTGPVDVGKQGWGVMIMDGAIDLSPLTTGPNGSLIGLVPGGNGTVIVLNGFVWDLQAIMDLGVTGIGVLSVIGGSSVSVNDIFLGGALGGNDRGAGAADIVGAASTLYSRNNLGVGWADRTVGNVRVADGGLVRTDGEIRIGAGPESTGTVSVMGSGGGTPSTLSSNAGIQLGDNAGSAGHLVVSGGGLVSSMANVVLGGGSESTASIKVFGSGSKLSSAGWIVLGSGNTRGAAASLSVSAGGLASAVGRVFIGRTTDRPPPSR